MNYSDDSKVTYSEVRLQLSAAWIRDNPKIFIDRYWGFFNEHKGWKVTASATKSNITLIAKAPEAA